MPSKRFHVGVIGERCKLELLSGFSVGVSSSGAPLKNWFSFGSPTKGFPQKRDTRAVPRIYYHLPAVCFQGIPKGAEIGLTFSGSGPGYSACLFCSRSLKEGGGI